MRITPDIETTVQLVGFFAGGKLFGIDVLSIREILRQPNIEPIQDAPRFIEGSVRLRGEVIPVISLKKRFGSSKPADQSDNRGHVLIANVNDVALAFLVDSVTRILKISEDTILPAPDIILTGTKSHYIRGVFNSEAGMLLVLDPQRMFGVDEIKALKNLVVPQYA